MWAVEVIRAQRAQRIRAQGIVRAQRGPARANGANRQYVAAREPHAIGRAPVVVAFGEEILF